MNVKSRVRSVFVDMRMPPGWDGIETTAKLWEVYPDLQVVICTAHSDYSWEDMVAKLERLGAQITRVDGEAEIRPDLSRVVGD